MSFIKFGVCEINLVVRHPRDKKLKSDQSTRRNFLKTAAVASLAIPASHAYPQAADAKKRPPSAGMDTVRRPDSITARFGMKETKPMQSSGAEWTLPGIKVSAEPVEQDRNAEIPIRVTSESTELTFLHLRWRGQQSEALQLIGDAWERSYGDLEWRGIVPNRIMPWYFFSYDGTAVHGHGVKTQPSAFCFWQSDKDGITLTVDLRNGGEATLFGQRELLACTVVMGKSAPGLPVAHATREFCTRLCPSPRLPKGAIFGSNDWNYAYGKNTAAGILRDADFIAAIAPVGEVRPYIVIDDGYQDPARFPSMANLASEIRKRQLRPGIWVRPLQPSKTSPASWLLPKARYGHGGGDPGLDPTIPEALDEALKKFRNAVDWGYEFIKHDFSTEELFGRWGFAMDTGPTSPGWHFQDRSRTNAEIVADLYRSMRNAAGEQTVILGCNTMGHISAGIFESQRIADDTSGHDWERTRRYGVNGLTHRIGQHRTFFHIDPDCVAITQSVDWRHTSQWMEVVARSGTSLFVSPEPGAVTPEMKSAIKDAFAIVSDSATGFPANPLQGTTPGEWAFEKPKRLTRNFDWAGPDGVSPFPV
jgi:alpha-galactosidase